MGLWLKIQEYGFHVINQTIGSFPVHHNIPHIIPTVWFSGDGRILARDFTNRQLLHSSERTWRKQGRIAGLFIGFWEEIKAEAWLPNAGEGRVELWLTYHSPQGIISGRMRSGVWLATCCLGDGCSKLVKRFLNWGCSFIP